MAEQPSPPSVDWVPIGDEYLAAVASTAPTIPALPTGMNAQGIQYGAILQAQGVSYYIRFDGVTCVAGATTARLMAATDWVVVLGYQAIKKLRFIQSAGSGSMAISHYFFRPGTHQTANIVKT